MSSARLSISVNGSVTQGYSLNNVSASFAISKDQNISNGSGNNALNTEFAADGKINAGGSVTFDISGTETGLFADTITMNYLKVLCVKNVSPDNGSEAQISISTNGIGFVADSSDIIRCPAGDVTLLTNLRGTGWTVTGASADTITLTNDDSGTGAWYEILLLGVTTEASSSSSSLSSLSSSSSSSPSSSSNSSSSSTSSYSSESSSSSTEAQASSSSSSSSSSTMAARSSSSSSSTEAQASSSSSSSSQSL